MAILTISREFGSGGREVGDAICKNLNYEMVDKDKLLKEMGITGHDWAEWGKGLDEHSPTVWERYDWSFKGFCSLIHSIILKYAAKDNVVIMERGGNLLMRGVPHAYRIRITAPLENRLENIMVRESVDYDTAKWLVERTDYDRSHFLMAAYGKDWNDVSLYDAVFNTADQGIPVLIQAVTDALLAKDNLKTPEIQRNMELRALAGKIEAGLQTTPMLFISVMDVLVEDGEVVLRGIVRDPKHKKRVEEAAKKLAEGHPIKSLLHYRVE